jgi:hypothetical protein
MLEKRLQRLDEQYRTYTVTCEDKMQKKKKNFWRRIGGARLKKSADRIKAYDYRRNVVHQHLLSWSPVQSLSSTKLIYIISASRCWQNVLRRREYFTKLRGFFFSDPALPTNQHDFIGSQQKGSCIDTAARGGHRCQVFLFRAINWGVYWNKVVSADRTRCIPCVWSQH